LPNVFLCAVFDCREVQGIEIKERERLVQRSVVARGWVIADKTDMLLHHASLAVQDPDVVASALAHYRRKPALGFSDCLVLEIARKAGHVPLGAFDRTLGRLEHSERLR